MRFRDLPAQRQPDSGTSRLRREERHEQVRRVHDPLAFVLHENLHAISRSRQPATTPPPVSRGSIDRVVQNVNQQLLELRGISAESKLAGPAGPEPASRVSRRPFA